MSFDVPTKPMSGADYSALHGDVEALAPRVAQILAPAGRRCIDVFCRTGALTFALERAEAKLVWSSDVDALIESSTKRRFVLGELWFLPMHPQLRQACSFMKTSGKPRDRARPSEGTGFDLCTCLAGIWRFVQGEQGARATIYAAAELLGGIGTLAFVTPTERAPDTPRTSTIEAAGRKICRSVYAHEGVRYEFTGTQGIAPRLDRGLDWSADEWAEALVEARFEPEQIRLSDETTLLRATIG